MAYALDDYDYIAKGENKETAIRAFYNFIRGSPLAMGTTQGGGEVGAAGLPRYAIAWLGERYNTGGYGSDTSSEGLQSTRHSTRLRRKPNPERMYGPSTSSSPRGGTA